MSFGDKGVIFCFTLNVLSLFICINKIDVFRLSSVLLCYMNELFLFLTNELNRTPNAYRT